MKDLYGTPCYCFVIFFAARVDDVRRERLGSNRHSRFCWYRGDNKGRKEGRQEKREVEM